MEQKRLNPCSNGMTLLSSIEIGESLEIVVLILVLME